MKSFSRVLILGLYLLLQLPVAMAVPISFFGQPNDDLTKTLPADIQNSIIERLDFDFESLRSFVYAYPNHSERIREIATNRHYLVQKAEREWLKQYFSKSENDFVGSFLFYPKPYGKNENKYDLKLLILLDPGLGAGPYLTRWLQKIGLGNPKANILTTARGWRLREFNITSDHLAHLGGSVDKMAYLLTLVLHDQYDISALAKHREAKGLLDLGMASAEAQMQKVFPIDQLLKFRITTIIHLIAFLLDPTQEKEGCFPSYIRNSKGEDYLLNLWKLNGDEIDQVTVDLENFRKN